MRSRAGRSEVNGQRAPPRWVRVSGRENGTSSHCCTTTSVDEPSPSTKRPGASSAIAAACMARRPAGRVQAGMMAVPRRTCSVTAATAARGVKPCSPEPRVLSSATLSGSVDETGSGVRQRTIACGGACTGRLLSSAPSCSAMMARARGHFRFARSGDQRPPWRDVLAEMSRLVERGRAAEYAARLGFRDTQSSREVTGEVAHAVRRLRGRTGLDQEDFASVVRHETRKREPTADQPAAREAGWESLPMDLLLELACAATTYSRARKTAGSGTHAGYTLTSVALTVTQTSPPSCSRSAATAAGVTSATIGGTLATRTRTRSPSRSSPAAVPRQTLRGVPSGRERQIDTLRG